MLLLTQLFTWVIIAWVVYRMPVRLRWEWFIRWAVMCVHAIVLLIAFAAAWWLGLILLVPNVVISFRTSNAALRLWRAAGTKRCVVCDRRATHERYYGMYGDDVTVELVCRRHMEEDE